MKMNLSPSLIAGAIALTFALPAGAQEMSVDTGECINNGNSDSYRLCIRMQRREQAALKMLTTNTTVPTNSLAEATQDRFNSYSNSTMAVKSMCDEMFTKLTVSNNMVAYSQVESLVNCYKKNSDMRSVNVLPSNKRATVRLSTQGNFRNSNGTMKSNQRVILKSNLSEGTGVPKKMMQEEPNSEVMLEEANSEGTGVPMDQ